MATARLRPVAAPTDTFVSGRLPGPKTRDVSGLVRGLGNLSGSLRRLGETQDHKQRVEAEGDALSAQEAIKNSPSKGILKDVVRLSPELNQDVLDRFAKAGIPDLNPYSFSLLKHLEGRDYVEQKGYADMLGEEFIEKTSDPDYDEANLEADLDAKRQELLGELPGKITQQYQLGLLEEMRGIERGFKRQRLNRKQDKVRFRKGELLRNEVMKTGERILGAMMAGGSPELAAKTFGEQINELALVTGRTGSGEALPHVAAGLESLGRKMIQADSEAGDKVLLLASKLEVFKTADGQDALGKLDANLQRARAMGRESDSRRDLESERAQRRGLRARIRELGLKGEDAVQWLSSDEALRFQEEIAREHGTEILDGARDDVEASMFAAYQRSSAISSKAAKGIETLIQTGRFENAEEAIEASQDLTTEDANQLSSLLEQAKRSIGSDPQSRKRISDVWASDVGFLEGLLTNPGDRAELRSLQADGFAAAQEALRAAENPLAPQVPEINKAAATASETWRKHPKVLKLLKKRSDLSPSRLLGDGRISALRGQINRFFSQDPRFQGVTVGQATGLNSTHPERLAAAQKLMSRLEQAWVSTIQSTKAEIPAEAFFDPDDIRDTVFLALTEETEKLLKVAEGEDKLDIEKFDSRPGELTQGQLDIRGREIASRMYGTSPNPETGLPTLTPGKGLISSQDYANTPLTEAETRGGLWGLGAPLSPYHRSQEDIAGYLSALGPSLTSKGANYRLGLGLLDRYGTGNLYSLGAQKFFSSPSKEFPQDPDPEVYQYAQIEEAAIAAGLGGKSYRGPKVDLATIGANAKSTREFNQLHAKWVSQNLPKNREELLKRARGSVSVRGLSPGEIVSGSTKSGIPVADLFDDGVPWDVRMFYSQENMDKVLSEESLADPESTGSRLLKTLGISPNDAQSLGFFKALQATRIDKDRRGLKAAWQNGLKSWDEVDSLMKSGMTDTRKFKLQF